MAYDSINAEEKSVSRANRFARKATAMICAGALACAALPATALAEQTGTGATDVTIAADANEHGGTEDATNPDSDSNGLGDKIAFTAPTEIAFTADASGALESSAASYSIENESAFPVHVTSMRVDAESGINVVSSTAIATATQSNAIAFKVGPNSDKLDAASYLTKAAVGTPSAWNMAAKGASGNADKVSMTASGQIANFGDISTATKVASAHWFVMAGAGS